jgi:hypothetical protein
MRVGTPLKIEWRDISTLSAWRDFDETIKDLEIEDSIRYETYGLFVRETNTHISLAATMSFKGEKIDQLADITNIVKGCIVNTTKI